MSFEDIANNGLWWEDGMSSKAPKHIKTFNSHIFQTLSKMANNLSGAVGMPDVLIYMYYYLMKDIETGYLDDKNIVREREQSWQEFIFNLNQNYLREGGTQSCYSNISVFDRDYFIGMFGEKTFPDGTMMIEHIEPFMQYQKDFLEYETRLRREKFFTFPVITASIIFKDDKFQDEDFVRYIAEHNIEFGDANVYISDTADNLSSCCFDKSTEFITSEGDIVSFADYKDGDEVIVPTHKSEAKKAKVKYFGKQDLNKVVFARQGQFNNDVYTSIKYVTANHRWLLEDGSKTNYLKVDDNIFIKDGYEWRVESIEPYKKNQDVWCLVVEDDESFILKDRIVTSNCRLKNDTSLLKGNFNSIGGTSLSIGSVKVITLNLVRCALESKNEKEFYENVAEKTRLVHDALEIQRGVIQKNIDKGLYPLYDAELIQLKNQYSTVGINGIFEAVKLLGGIEYKEETGYNYTEKGKQMAIKIMNVINDLNVARSQELGFTFNMEQVPFESGSVKHYKKDKLLYQDRIDNEIGTGIYGNQWIPLNIDCSLFHRLEMSALLDKEASGGAILHINRSNKITPEQNYENMIAYAKMGIVYYSDIIKMNICENDHTYTQGSDICPICGGKKVDEAIKVVGYIVKKSAFQKERKKEMGERVFYKN